jgi:hypothetical protein
MLSRKALRMLHSSYLHSIIFYGIIFGGNTPNGIKFSMQNNFINYCITNSKNMDSCRKLFKQWKFTVYSQYQFSLSLYVVNNKQIFIKNVEAHNHDTRSANTFHLPRAFFLGGRRGTRTPKHFVNLTGETKNFKMLEFPLNQLQTYYGYLSDLLSFL